MRIHKSVSINKIAEVDRQFQDFVASVSVTKEELTVLTSMPEFSSVHEVREYLREGKRSKNSSPLMLEVLRHFQRTREVVAAAFVAVGSPNYRPSSSRKA